jgi:hypothetical protein
MLLRYYDNKISYEQSVYDSGACHGLIYKPGDLSFRNLGFVGGHEDFYWLADLYGLSFVPKRVELEQETGLAFTPGAEFGRAFPAAIVIVKDEKEAWNKFIEQICDYLEKGVPVQTSRAWMPLLGPWWSGIPKEHRPGNHWIVVVGVDKSKGVVYIHSPWPKGPQRAGADPWVGMTQMGLEDFKRSIEANGYPSLKYLTHVFLKTPFSGIEDREKAVGERNQKRLRGDASVYSKSYVGQGFVFGLAGLRAFKEDLSPENFRRIMEEKELWGITAIERTTWMSLFMYQYSFLSNLGANYLKAIGKTNQEQKLLKKLHTLYDRLRGSSEKLNSVFRRSKSMTKAIVKCEPILEEMRKTTAEIIQSIEDYLSANL